MARVRELPEATGQPTAVTAISVEAQRALQLRALSGRLFDEGMMIRKDRVALIGDLAASGLGYTTVDGRATIYVSGREYSALGIFESSDPSLALSIVLPDWVVEDSGSGLTFQDPTVFLHTDLGAAQQVGVEACLALAPENPESIAASVPPDPRSLRRSVESDTRNLFFSLAFVSVLVGGLGVSNTMLVAVLERRYEIGVRRALGATSGLIMGQILIEGAVLGGFGGLIGTLAGIDLNFAVSLIKGWTAVLPIWLLFAGPGLGILMGFAAGLYPAARAVAMEPVAALTT